MRPRLLDLFCGAGGCSVGYHRAGFDVVGVDLHPQPNYPYRFLQGDALTLLDRLIAGDPVAFFIDRRPIMFGLEDFDAIHASPPCQAYSSIAKQARQRNPGLEHPDLVEPTRDLLNRTGRPYVIENVVGAPLIEPTLLCGSMFGLDVRRHRLFETNWALMAPRCQHGVHWPRFRSLDSRRGLKSVVPVHGGGQLASVVGVHGHINYAGEQELRKKAMDIDWMSPYELTQAIPPAYTELIGHQLMAHVRVAA